MQIDNEVYSLPTDVRVGGLSVAPTSTLDQHVPGGGASAGRSVSSELMTVNPAYETILTSKFLHAASLSYNDN